MTKTKFLSIKPIKSKRKKQIHYYETAVFKDKLRLSIERNIRDFISDKEDFNFNHTVEQLLAPCKKTRGKRGRITRPQNAFILYRKDFHDQIKKENPNATFEQISKIIGEQWTSALDETKNRYILLAKLCSRVHRDIFPNYKFMTRLTREKKDDIIPKESKESEKELQRPWSPLSSIIVPEESQPSLNEQTTLFNLGINMPQENYGVVNALQETQLMTESHYLDPMTELIDMFQSNKQFTTNCHNYPNYFDYETQSTEILPFDLSENACVDTTLPFRFNENTSIDTTLPLHFIQSTPQDFNDYPFGTVNSDSFLFNATFDSFESTNEYLYNIFDLTDI
ncbi:1531_t:CDS:1 [Cetraspora pellucida]|uniref:1531_t:CDS:1 n=1 Tax=Cetraspora pellucida TaxID=1433469 RepID=A0ACA9K6I8_9GLOM|nr:1531_t:CDS:1 [Cetraspora pellucida]